MLVICEHHKVCKTASNVEICEHGRLHEHDASCDNELCGSSVSYGSNKVEHRNAKCLDGFIELVKDAIEVK